MKKILTWLKPTWEWLHLWNYFWAFKPFLDLAKGNIAYMFLADYHSLTSVHNKENLKKFKKRMLIEYFSLFPEDSLQMSELYQDFLLLCIPVSK